MKWDMEMEEIEAMLEKIWDLHDKLSDTIHSISRTHFLKTLKKPPEMAKTNKNKKLHNDDKPANGGGGFVFVKDYDCESAAIQEAKSLNTIRTALENLEDQLEFFHTVQTHQRAERDAAIARLEQSRIILAMRLAEHHGKNYKVIQEALAFVGDVEDAGRFVSPENLYGTPESPSGDNFVVHKGKKSNALIRFLISSFNFAKTSFKMDSMGGILGNAAMFAVSMIALLHLHQVAYKQHEQNQDDIYHIKNVRRTPQLEGSSSYRRLNHLDVTLARG